MYIYRYIHDYLYIHVHNEKENKIVLVSLRGLREAGEEKKENEKIKTTHLHMNII
jgi:hypothetical protein